MIPTVFGAFIGAIGPLLLLFGAIDTLLIFVLAMTLLGGSSAITLTALGGSSISPANLAICFLILRYALPGPRQSGYVSAAIIHNRILALFVMYGVIGAYVLPRIFANAMYVTPLHPHPTRDPFAAEPLVFTSQNITVSVYFLQTLLAAVGAHIVASSRYQTSTTQGRNALRRLAKAASIVTLVHASLGILSVVAKERLGGFFNFFRNGSYAQLNQELGEVARMNGIFPEASIYSEYGFAWMVFVTELWLRDVCPSLTGLAAAVMAFTLVCSTSSTAYVGLLAYAMILAARMVMGRGAIPLRKITVLVGAAIAGLTGVIALAVLSPTIGARLGQLLSSATVMKTQSLSAMQRGFWAKQGLSAFTVSKGLGIGAGSFRSSSILTSILGCMGVVGIVTFTLHLLKIFMPLRRSTWDCQTDPGFAVGAAASWAAVVMLVPLVLTAPSPDPGLVWGTFCGLALALRGDRTRMPGVAPAALTSQ